MVIGIIGTSKNTGKTTTLSHLLRHYHHHRIKVGVTGIGYDGEEIDNITFLPKPRLYLESETVATTSEKCLQSANAEFEILERTGIITALGEVVIVRITKPGLLVIAGPNRLRTLSTVISAMRRYNADPIFVDGSLNRISPMSVADYIIVTTGGARSTDIHLLSAEMKAVASFFALPLTTHTLHPSGIARLFSVNGETQIPISSLLDRADVHGLKKYCSPYALSLFVPNLVSQEALEALGELKNDFGIPVFEVIISDPFALLLSGEPIRTHSTLETLLAKELRISFHKKTSLAAVTINPFYPDFQGHSYHTAYLDKEQLLESMKKNLPNIPVFNLTEDGSEDLFKLLHPDTH